MRTLGVAATLFVGARRASAACDANYTGPASGAWQTAGNWDTNAAPTTAQGACIPSGKGTILIANGVSAVAKNITSASALQIDGGGSLALSDAVAGFSNHLANFTLAAGGGITSAGSSIDVEGTALVNGTISAALKLVVGSLSGTGTISGVFTNEGGTLRPGGSGVVGTLEFGSFIVQQSGGTLELDLASDVSFDRLHGPTGNHFLDGNLVITLLGGYSPSVGTIWKFIPDDGFGTQIGMSESPSAFNSYSIPLGAALELNAPLSSSTTSTVISSTTSTTSAPSTTSSSTIVSTSTSSTTLSPSTTSSSTTAPPSSSSTSTTVTTTTTSSTVPGSCAGPRAATFESIDCRLEALIATIADSDDVSAKLKQVFAKQLGKAREKEESAGQGASSAVTRRVLGDLKKSRRKVIGFAYRLRSHAGQRGVSEPTASMVGTAGDEIAVDLKTLRDELRGG